MASWAKRMLLLKKNKISRRFMGTSVASTRSFVKEADYYSIRARLVRCAISAVFFWSASMSFLNSLSS